MGQRLHQRGAAARAAAAASNQASQLDGVSARLAAGPASALPSLVAAQLLSRASTTREAAGSTPDADRLAAFVFAADVLLELAADGRLDGAGARATVQAVSEATATPLEVSALDLYSRAVVGSGLLELPPRVAVEIALHLLVHLGVADQVSLWCRSVDDVVPLIAIGWDTDDIVVPAAARQALDGGRRSRTIADPGLTCAVVRRLGAPYAVIVARTGSRQGRAAYLSECAEALQPVLEREALLSRGTAREKSVTQAAERRLTRLGFDLHDGPIQEVLALAEDLRRLRDELMPFVLEGQRELASGRFDDSLARLIELDRSLREISHELESKSIVARPLEEVLHREVDRFAARSGIAAHLVFDGDTQALTASQRIVVYRAIQESLTNIREHSGATDVELHVRAGRGAVDLTVTDDGNGFEVEHALVRAAQRGRLGLVGIGERVHMLGGTFDIDSSPGGPTTLRLALPRWEKLEPLPHQGGGG